LAHLGVLFLDELAEFQRPSLEALRQPLEDGRLVLGRAAGRASFPAEVLLVAATNPCPCGWYGESGERCKCPKRAIGKYHARISGPLRDRFDLEVRVGAVDAEKLVGEADPEDGPVDERDLERARKAQRRRAKRLGLGRAFNARIPPKLLPGAIEPTREAERVLVRHARTLGLTGRGVHRVMRVARTIADLAGSEHVEPEHVETACGLRSG
jgi:magnesium chelatase family protein